MKKFYTHNGSEQEGPFDLDDLRSKKIYKDTSIWFEGLSDWAKAENVDELKSLFGVMPPAFSKEKPSPAFQEATSKNTVSNPQLPRKNKSILIATTIIGAVVLVILVMVANNPNSIPGIKVEVNTPKPVVVTHRGDFSKSGLFNARMTVYATVLNQGGDGNVVVTFYAYQEKKTYDRSKEIYLSANESKDLEVTFEEVTHLGGEVTYRVVAK